MKKLYSAIRTALRIFHYLLLCFCTDIFSVALIALLFGPNEQSWQYFLEMMRLPEIPSISAAISAFSTSYMLTLFPELSSAVDISPDHSISNKPYFVVSMWQCVVTISENFLEASVTAALLSTALSLPSQHARGITDSWPPFWCVKTILIECEMKASSAGDHFGRVSHFPRKNLKELWKLRYEKEDFWVKMCTADRSDVSHSKKGLRRIGCSLSRPWKESAIYRPRLMTSRCLLMTPTTKNEW